MSALNQLRGDFTNSSCLCETRHKKILSAVDPDSGKVPHMLTAAAKSNL